MDEVKLTKDADNLICVLYKEYLNRRKSGSTKSSARGFGGSRRIQATLMEKWLFEDVDDTCRELSRAKLLSCLILDNEVGETVLTDKGIIYMENRFKNNIAAVVDHIESLKSLLPW